jgi:hypothetical protein
LILATITAFFFGMIAESVTVFFLPFAAAILWLANGVCYFIQALWVLRAPITSRWLMRITLALTAFEAFIFAPVVLLATLFFASVTSQINLIIGILPIIIIAALLTPIFAQVAISYLILRSIPRLWTPPTLALRARTALSLLLVFHTITRFFFLVFLLYILLSPMYFSDRFPLQRELYTYLAYLAFPAAFCHAAAFFGIVHPRRAAAFLRFCAIATLCEALLIFIPVLAHICCYYNDYSYHMDSPRWLLFLIPMPLQALLAFWLITHPAPPADPTIRITFDIPTR